MTRRGDGTYSEGTPVDRRRAAVTGARSSEQGSAAVLALVLAVVLVTVAVAAGALGGLLVGQRRAAAAADLAALAAAEALTGVAAVAPAPVDSCGQAERIAAANGARLTGCRAEGLEVTVSVVVEVPVPVAGAVEVAGRARAGPAVSGSAGPVP